MDTRLDQISNDLKAVQKELAQTKSALDAYTKPPPLLTNIEGSPICARFFVSVASPVKPVTAQAFAAQLFKCVPNDAGIYAVERGRGFRHKDDIFLLEAVIIVTSTYVYLPTIATQMFEAFLDEGYYTRDADHAVMHFVNLQRTADAISVLHDIVNMQKEVSGSEQGNLITLLPSGELDESQFTLEELDPCFSHVRREYPLLNKDGTCVHPLNTSFCSKNQ